MIILNEEEYANERLKRNDIGENPYTTINILAKHYYHIVGLKKKEIKECLIDFLNSTYPRYATDKTEWEKTIDNIIKNVHKNKLFVSNGIAITENELVTIGKLNDTTLEKLAFTLLCIAKYKNQKSKHNNNWVNTTIKDIYNMACIKCSKKDKAIYIGELINKGYVRYANKIDNLNIKVLFMDSDSEVKIIISDFRRLGNEYLYYNGGNFVRCADCGLLVSNNKNKTRKYCDDCGTYTPLKTKIISCVDCGRAIIVSGSNKRTCRCNLCQIAFNREKDKLRKRRKKEN